MKKVLIFGNSGSGKSWLSGCISERLNVKEINLDGMFWEPGGYNKKRTQEAIDCELTKLGSESTWVIEGVFGALVEKLIFSADTLIFLDIDWSTCEKSLLSRGSESSVQLNRESAEKNFQELLNWASQYNLRNSKNSYNFHNHIFNQFTGNKIRFSTREEVNSFISSVGLRAS